MLAIRELRKALGLSRSQLARLVGCSAESIERYEVVVPPERLRQFAALALERGLPDLAAEFQAALEGGRSGPTAGPKRFGTSESLSVEQQRLLADLAAAVRANPGLLRPFRVMLEALGSAPAGPRLKRRRARAH